MNDWLSPITLFGHFYGLIWSQNEQLNKPDS